MVSVQNSEPRLEQPRLLLTVSQVAEQLGLGRTKIYELIGRGEIPSVRIGTARRVPAAGLAAYVERLISEQAGAD